MALRAVIEVSESLNDWLSISSADCRSYILDLSLYVSSHERICANRAMHMEKAIHLCHVESHLSEQISTLYTIPWNKPKATLWKFIFVPITVEVGY